MGLTEQQRQAIAEFDNQAGVGLLRSKLFGGTLSIPEPLKIQIGKAFNVDPSALTLSLQTMAQTSKEEKGVDSVKIGVCVNSGASTNPLFSLCVPTTVVDVDAIHKDVNTERLPKDISLNGQTIGTEEDFSKFRTETKK